MNGSTVHCQCVLVQEHSASLTILCLVIGVRGAGSGVGKGEGTTASVPLSWLLDVVLAFTLALRIGRRSGLP